MLEIRFAIQEDYEKLIELIKQIHNQHVGYNPDVFKNVEIPMSKEEFINLLSENSIIVGLVDNKIIGYTYFLVRQNRCNILVDRKFIFIDSIVILNEFQGRGYGKLFIEYLKKYAKENNCDSLELNVNAKNKAAINFYLNNDFSERERRMEIKI